MAASVAVQRSSVAREEAAAAALEATAMDLQQQCDAELGVVLPQLYGEGKEWCYLSSMVRARSGASALW